MPLITTELWNRHTEAEIDWAPMEVSGISASALAYPRLGINRWGERLIVEMPSIASKLECTELADEDWQFSLDANKSLRYRRVVDIEMPDGEVFRPEYGALRIDFILQSHPGTTDFPMRLTLPSGCLMLYQDELTPEEVALGSVRPTWCVGSYACYTADHRKLGHFPRPWAMDAKGKWTWGEWLWDPVTGILAKRIPQKFLDTATYPVIVDDTFGETDVGGTTQELAGNFMGGFGPYSPALDGTLDSVAFLAKADESGTQVTLGVYEDSSGSPAGQSLVDQSAGGAGVNGAGVPAWCTQNVVTGEAVSSGSSYHIGKNTNANWTTGYDADGGIKFYYKASAYSGGNLDDPFPAGPSSLNWIVSAYANYTPGAAGTGTGTGVITEGVTAADSWANLLTALCQATDGATAGDALGNLLTALATVAEGVTGGDAYASILGALAAMAEGATAGDAFAGLSGLLAEIDDTANAADAYVTVATLLAAATEGAKAGDAFASVATVIDALVDGAKAGDTFAGVVLAGIISAAATEGSKAGETLMAVLSAVAGLSEAVATGAVFASQAALLAVLTESTEASDAFAAVVSALAVVSSRFTLFGTQSAAFDLIGSRKTRFTLFGPQSDPYVLTN